jgi:hypothetical protein
MSTNETIDELRERFYEREIKKGCEHNQALALACRLADAEMRGQVDRGELAIAASVVEPATVTSVGPTASFTHETDDDGLVDKLRQKYLRKELAKGVPHNHALAAACSKAGAKVRQLAEAKLAASNASPPPAADPASEFAALHDRAAATGDELDVAAKRLELLKVEFRASLRSIIREELASLRGNNQLLVGGGRR